MTQRYPNPFTGIWLLYPAEQEEVYKMYTQPGSNKAFDARPFPRMVDLWFASICLAVRKGLKPVSPSGKTSRLYEGSAFDNDQDRWRVQALMLIAIFIEDSVDIVTEPRRIIDIANNLAATGVPHIKKMLENGNDDEIWNLSEGLCDLLSEANG